MVRALPKAAWSQTVRACRSWGQVTASQARVWCYVNTNESTGSVLKHLSLFYLWLSFCVPTRQTFKCVHQLDKLKEKSKNLFCCFGQSRSCLWCSLMLSRWGQISQPGQPGLPFFVWTLNCMDEKTSSAHYLQFQLLYAVYKDYIGIHLKSKFFIHSRVAV